ncbi:MAG: hypothetical protein JEY99_17155 [Spirochaetales bacterium]|nr:hypothetical protein [Spirochaetales bacterium]
MNIAEPRADCKVVDGKAYYTLAWSPLTRVDKYSILKKVPAMSGIYELYYYDEHKNLFCFFICRVWYGGLRGAIREATDPLIVMNPKRKAVLEERECFFRYTVVTSFADIRDLMNLLGMKRGNPETAPPDSDRYEELFFKEESPDKIVNY